MNPNQPPSNKPGNNPPSNPAGGRSVLPPPTQQQAQQILANRNLKKQFWIAMAIIVACFAYLTVMLISAKNDHDAWAERAEKREQREERRKEERQQREAREEEERLAKLNSPLPERDFNGLAYPIKNYILDNAHDRRSIEFVSVSPLYRTDTEGVYRQDVRFRGKNAFGAYVLTDVSFYTTKIFALPFTDD